MSTKIDPFTITDKLQQVDTVQAGGNGYPRGLKVAFTADTMRELREAYEAAKAGGVDAEIIHLHRRNGWAMWERMSHAHEFELEDDQWTKGDGNTHVIDIGQNSDRLQLAFDHLCGSDYSMCDGEELIRVAKDVQALASSLPDPDTLEDGQSVACFMDDCYPHQINYTVKTGQNGYSHDTHQYCIGLIFGDND